MSGSDDEHDAYLAAVKAEGEERGNDDDSGIVVSFFLSFFLSFLLIYKKCSFLDMSSDDQDFVAVSSSDVGLE